MVQGITKEKFTDYIKKFDFQSLFIDLGWDYDDASGNVNIGETLYHYKVIAKLQGFYIIVISSKNEPEIPVSSIRKQISTFVSKTYPENLLIFHGEKTQYWSYRIEVDKDKEKYSETVFYSEKEADALFQRASGLFFQLDEYDRITFVDVKSRVRTGFTVNYDAVTKRFYDHFKREHESFKKAIEGIIDANDLDWYTSVTLNRLMFCYFIQKKGFLDGDTNYLQNKLQLFINQEDDTGFFSFYLDFLMILFHDGLGGRERDEKKRELLGKIPYLNGGMFEVHELEQKYDSIRIHNKAFKEIFDFFDQYKWHLDINPDAPGNEINPDVLGYIFEKYINQRAEMGAYYTKEDITGYIGKNTILPFLFDEVKRKYPEPFKDQGEVWKFLKNSGDKYIYPAMKFGIPKDVLDSPESNGIFDDLPDSIKAGLNPEQKDLWKIRKPWNKPAPNDIALSTEIYREVIERRNRYKDVKSIITSGSITEVNDLITHNLDIINFTQDLLTYTEDSKLVEHFYKAIEKVTILDPTCGSGAFLFAAMNILQPLYEILIERMRSFVYDEDRINAVKYATRKGGFLYKYPYFREILGKVSGLKDPNDPESGQNHPNQKYFILKSIILNNLYGVDIMREAVEIAKLRLFLKLVAQVHPNPNEDNLGIEPLPDMDFNLKTGNTLVGFGTKQEIDTLSSLLVDDNEREKIYTECDKISRIFENFKDAQLSHGETNLLKKEIKERINKLNNRLDILLYTAHYGGGVFSQWHSSHQPFHWFAEFYGIFDTGGGFDVVIGNPPYVEYSEKKFNYKPRELETTKCGNLYPFILEQSLLLKNDVARIGFIIPFGGVSTPRMLPLIRLLQTSSIIWNSNFDERPSYLFDGVCLQLSIVISARSKKPKRIISPMIHWSGKERFDHTSNNNILFESKIKYVKIEGFTNSVFPKLGNDIEHSILSKMGNFEAMSNYFSNSGTYQLYYKSAGGRYYKIITDFIPQFSSSRSEISKAIKIIKFDSKDHRDIAICILSSNLFYWYWRKFSDCRNLTNKELYNFPFHLSSLSNRLNRQLIELKNKYMDSLTANSISKELNNNTTGSIIMTEFRPRNSKNIIDEIDDALSSYYSFSGVELDFLINDGVKYRLGEDVD